MYVLFHETVSLRDGIVHLVSLLVYDKVVPVVDDVSLVELSVWPNIAPGAISSSLYR